MAARLWSYTISSTAETGAATSAATSGHRCRSVRARRTFHTAGVRNGVNAITPPGVSAVVAPASRRPPTSGRSLRVAIARSTSTQQPSSPAATHGSGRRPRQNGTHQVLNASAASQGLWTPSRGSA